MMFPHVIVCHSGASSAQFVIVEVWAPSMAVAELVARLNGYVPAR